MTADPIRGRFREIGTDVVAMPVLAGISTLIATHHFIGSFRIHAFYPSVLTTEFVARCLLFGIVSHFAFSFSLHQHYRARSLLLVSMLCSCALTTYVFAFYLVRAHRAMPYGTLLAVFFALTFAYQTLRYKIYFAKLASHRETVLILGTGREAQKVWKHLRTHCDQLVAFQGFVAESASRDAAPDILARTACTIDSLDRFLHETPVDTFVLTSTGPDDVAFAEAAKQIARNCGSRLLSAPGPAHHPLFARWFHDACDDYVELGRPNLSTRCSLLAKALGDRALGGAALLFALPIALPLLLLYRLALGESALVSQPAYGYHRRQFKMWDLRIATGKERPIYDASRHRIRRIAAMQAKVLARVGYFLQISGLARAPRLWNVFVGDMSLVGPRPVLPAQIAVGDPSALLRRYTMRPGICWPKAQTLRLQDQATLSYLEHWSPALDWTIFKDWVSSRVSRTAYAISASLVPDHTALAEPTRRPW